MMEPAGKTQEAVIVSAFKALLPQSLQHANVRVKWDKSKLFEITLVVSAADLGVMFGNAIKSALSRETVQGAE